MLREDRGDLTDERPVLELARGDVDAERQWAELREAAAPVDRLCTCGPEHPSADRDDETHLLGEGNEVERRDQSAIRMLPAQERLGARDRLVRELHVRLVVDVELAALERVAEVRLELHPLDDGVKRSEERRVGKECSLTCRSR